MANIFEVPVVFHDRHHWGPVETPTRFQDLPYKPFSKRDRLGRAADFSASRGKGWRNRDEDIVDTGFEVVDTIRQKRVDIRKYYRRGQRGARPQHYQHHQHQHQGHTTQHPHRRHRDRRRGRREIIPRPHREPSVKIDSAWDMVEQFDLAGLPKLSTPVPSGTDVAWHGNLKAFRNELDTIFHQRARKPLKQFRDREYVSVTACEDPVIQEAASSEDCPYNVFASDTVLAHLMTCSRAILPWDIVVTVFPGNEVFLDMRDMYLEMQTVNETAHKPLSEDDTHDINSRRALENEATRINVDFAQMVLDEKSSPEGLPSLHENPFFDPEEHADDGVRPAHVAFRYRSWQVSPDIRLLARCTVNGVQRKGGRNRYISVFALNDWGQRPAGELDWRKHLVDKTSTILTTEIKNNGAKVARWTAKALLADSSQVKIGYVARASSNDPTRHELLGVQSKDPGVLSTSISLRQENMWGVLRWLVELVRSKAAEYRTDDESVVKFLLMRDPMKDVVMLFNIPPDAFEEDDDNTDVPASASQSHGPAAL